MRFVFKNSGGVFDFDGKSKRLIELDKIAAQEGFWNDSQNAQVLLKERTQIKSLIDAWEEEEKTLLDAKALLDLSLEEKDDETLIEAQTHLEKSEKGISSLELKHMLKGEMDMSNAILSIKNSNNN